MEAGRKQVADSHIPIAVEAKRGPLADAWVCCRDVRHANSATRFSTPASLLKRCLDNGVLDSHRLTLLQTLFVQSLPGKPLKAPEKDLFGVIR